MSFLLPDKHKVKLCLIIIIIFFLVSRRENYETWSLLIRARNEGRLFTKINWPKGSESVRTA